MKSPDRLQLAVTMSTVALSLAVPAWGVVGALAITSEQEMSADLQRFLLFFLSNVTLGALAVNLTVRSMIDQRVMLERQRRMMAMLRREHDAGARVVQLGDRIARRLVDVDS